VRVYPPEIVVDQFAGGGLFEARHFDSLWIDPVEDMPDGAVLATCVHRLQHHQHFVLGLRPKQLLELLEPLGEEGEPLSTFVFVEPDIISSTRRPFIELDAGFRRNAIVAGLHLSLLDRVL
jgi:hypothetical protein